MWTTDYLTNFNKWQTLAQIPTILKEKDRFIEADDCSSIKRVGYMLKDIVIDEPFYQEYQKEQATDLALAQDNTLTSEEIQQLDQIRLEDAFTSSLKFGTAGLRGKIGPGIQCMNTYTVATATAGMAESLLARYGFPTCQTRGVVIGYDTRYHSALFAKTAALVFAGYGIRVNLFPTYCSTPLLAYSIKPLGSLAGIMVTASHNPKAYNGYKVYGEDGIQIGSEIAEHIASRITDDYKIISLKEAEQQELLHFVSEIIERDYLKDCEALVSTYNTEETLRIAYTPIHGTGAKYVLPLLHTAGFHNIFTVKEQLEPDSSFTTAPAPNPEFWPAMELLKEYATQNKCELGIATDPDADRLSILIPDDQGEYHLLDGNQIGALLANFWFAKLESAELPEQPQVQKVMAKSIVTNNLGAKIASKYQVEVRETLTGFKNLCGVEKTLLEENRGHKLVMAYEESIGYAINPKVADKDGIFAALVLAKAAAFYKQTGRTLWQILEQLQKEFGYHFGNTINRVREGQQGVALMKHTMEQYRKIYPQQIGNHKLTLVEDFLFQTALAIEWDGQTQIAKQRKILMDKSDVLRFVFEDGSWYAMRPSGTEPKLKIYINVEAATKEEANQKLVQFNEAIVPLLDKLEEDFKKLQAKKDATKSNDNSH